MNRLRLQQSSPIIGPGGVFSLTGNGAGETYYNAKVPQALSTTVYRTPSVDAGDESIFLQEEMAYPHSPPATSWLVTGADATYFQAGAVAGSIVFNAATRASMTRRTYTLTVTPIRSGVGTGTAQTLTVVVPLLVNEYFVQYSALNQSGNGTFGAPYKFMPGTSHYTGTAKSFRHGDVIFMKGEIHRTAHWNSLTSIIGYMDHFGTTGDPVVVEFSGWGTLRATLDGSDVITGGTTVTQAEVGGNPNYTNIRKFDLSSQGGALEYFQMAYDGPTMLYRAQYPTPVDLRQVNSLDSVSASGSEKYGLKNITCATSGGTARISTDGGADFDGYPARNGTTITLTDPAIAARYGNVAYTALPRFVILLFGNFLGEVMPSGYDYLTSTVTFNSAFWIGVNSNTNKCAYGTLFSPVDIVQAGQYALSNDGLTLYMWPPNNSTISVSRRYSAVQWADYVKYRGGDIQRFCNGSKRAGGATDVGCAFYFYGNNNYRNESDVINMRMSQCKADNNAMMYGIASSGGNTTGFRSTNIELCTFADNFTSGLRFSTMWEGSVTSGSAAATRAATRGKIRANYFKPFSTDQTALLLQGANGAHVTLNCFRGNKTIHGNCISLYDTTSGSYQSNQYCVIDLNQSEDCARFYTTETNPAVTDRHNTVEGNYVLDANTAIYGGQSSPVSLNGGDPGVLFNRNLFMGFDSSYSAWIGLYVNGSNVTVTNNVMSGIQLPVSWTGTVTNNYFTVAPQTANNLTSGGTQSGNTQLTGVSQIGYFTSFTGPMLTTLGAGQIGCFTVL